MDFSKKLQQLREDNKISQQQLATQLGVTWQTVNSWENGQSHPEAEILLHIGRLFHVSFDYLLKDNDAMITTDGSSLYASRELVRAFLLEKQQSTQKIAFGVATMVFATCFPILFTGVSGYILFLVFAIIGGFNLLSFVLRPKHYQELEDQPLVLDPVFLKNFRVFYTKHRKRWRLLILAGVLCIVFGIAFTLLLHNVFAAMDERFFAILPVFVAGGFVLGILGIGHINAYTVIAENGNYLENPKEQQLYGWVWVSTMLLATIVFLAIGFFAGAWHPGWLVLPTGAVIGLVAVWFLKLYNR